MWRWKGLQEIVSEKRKLQSNVSSMKQLYEVKRKNKQVPILHKTNTLNNFFISNYKKPKNDYLWEMEVKKRWLLLFILYLLVHFILSKVRHVYLIFFKMAVGITLEFRLLTLHPYSYLNDKIIPATTRKQAKISK